MLFNVKMPIKSLSAVVATMALVFVGAPPASAATCKGTLCTGKNPASAGCAADAITLGSDGDAAPWEVELRYSATCSAAWARGSAQGFAPVEISVERRRTGTTNVTRRYTWIVDDPAARSYTLMLSWTTPFEYRACGKDAVVTKCSSWYRA